MQKRYKNRHFSDELKNEVKLELLTVLQREIRHTTEEPAAEASMAPGSDPEEASAKKPRILLFSVHDEILKENMGNTVPCLCRYRATCQKRPLAELTMH